MAVVEDNDAERLPIIDTDVHATVFPTAPEVMRHLSNRWQEHLASIGLRGMSLCGERPTQRAMSARADAWGPDGGLPGTDPGFVREQLLDRYDLSGAVMNDNVARIPGSRRTSRAGRAGGRAIAGAERLSRSRRGLRRTPAGTARSPCRTRFGVARQRSVAVARSEFGERWVQVLMAPDNEKPAGHPKYWPIYEACEHYEIPVAFHVLAGGRSPARELPNYYFEEHTQFAGYNFPLVAQPDLRGRVRAFPEAQDRVDRACVVLGRCRSPGGWTTPTS